jgi:eukaryotic-like serine/threonine-protein kinase
MTGKPDSSTHAASLPPLSGGRQLAGKFEILGVLGEGATGIVYDAQRIAEGDRVALKVIHPHLAGDPQIRGRFAREAAILRRLEGEHLRPILDFGEAPDPRRAGAGLLYMALPRVDGPALDTLLEEEGELPVTRAVAIILNVCGALREAHAQGVIHRDLKPGNVLITGGDRAVVVDFGMAKIVAGVGTGTTALTQSNMVFGTPEYMAPEQARGDELDARCDIYATGIMLYELLTGTVPFPGNSPLYVLTAHMTVPPEPPRARAPSRAISPALEAVVLHAIAKDPARRYATAAALEAAIHAALADPLDPEAVAPSPRVHSATDSAEPAAPASPSAVGVRGSPMSAGAPTGASSRAWLFVCIAAAIAGIAVGAWLSMHFDR